MKYRYFLSGILLLVCQFSMASHPQQQVEQTLNIFHQAASDANSEVYFSLLTDNAIFIGTDANERWNKKQFQQFATPYFDKGKGWTYLPRNRHVHFSKDQNLAWFDELLDNTSYGECRGTGVLELTSSGWKISQYHLTIPVPNDLAAGIVKQINAFNSQQETQGE